ncbi:MAG: carboxylating nicotinate-nucleotide diphosphorylase [Candidatus Caenarcaniphilales bacterium]|nr:carboxylating nicotinate-nucleotide diphosphorylase [Candidatus Caenarcaniphilales bacterium]
MAFSLDKLIQIAIAEDLSPCGDITTDLTIDKEIEAVFFVKSRRQSGVFSGFELAKRTYSFIDESINFEEFAKAGDTFAPNDRLLRIQGNAQSILKGERIFLNLIQKATSIATYTNQFVELIKGTETKILDTRKTTPGFRELERKAVTDGGGHNHRYNLSTGLMIKDNHIALAGGIENAINKVKLKQPYLTKLEVEVDSIQQLKTLLDFDEIDVVLLDNFCLEEIVEAKKLIGNKTKIEVSGGVNLNTVRQIAEIGVDYISIGSLTQSPPIIDLGLDFE